MLLPSTAPVPLLLLLSLLVPPLAQAQQQPRGFDLPLLRHSTLSRRTDPEALQKWALREKSRVHGKYGGGEEANRRERRQTTPLSVAGYGTVTKSSTATSSAKAAIPTTPTGMVVVSNYEADL